MITLSMDFMINKLFGNNILIKNLFNLKKLCYGQNYLFIMKSILKIIIHALELLQKNFECFISKPDAHGTF